LLRLRLIQAALILVPTLTLLWLDYSFNFGRPGMWLLPLLLFGAAVGTSEVLWLFTARAMYPSPSASYLGTIGVVVLTAIPLLWGESYPPDCPIGRFGWPLLAISGGLLVAFVVEMWRFEKPGGAMQGVSLALFPMVYIGLLSSFFILLRLSGSNGRGLAAVITTVAVAKLSDTGAFFVGRSFGRRKLFPILSPGKTLEGAVGGFALAALAAWAIFTWLVPPLAPEAKPTPLWASLLFGIVIAAAAMLGDLAASLIKRDMRAKDSSGWMGGLGGVLDTMDSLLSSAPVAFVFWQLRLVAPY